MSGVESTASGVESVEADILAAELGGGGELGEGRSLGVIVQYLSWGSWWHVTTNLKDKVIAYMTNIHYCIHNLCSSITY